jgi:hypothetical protein
MTGGAPGEVVGSLVAPLASGAVDIPRGNPTSVVVRAVYMKVLPLLSVPYSVVPILMVSQWTPDTPTPFMVTPSRRKPVSSSLVWMTATSLTL